MANPAEKRTRQAIANDVAAIAEATVERLADVERLTRQLVSDERTARLKLADEQRAYVDQLDRRLTVNLAELRARGFWSR